MERDTLKRQKEEKSQRKWENKTKMEAQLGKHKKDVFWDNKERIRVKLWWNFEVEEREFGELILFDVLLDKWMGSHL